MWLFAFERLDLLAKVLDLFFKVNSGLRELVPILFNISKRILKLNIFDLSKVKVLLESLVIICKMMGFSLQVHKFAFKVMNM